LVGFKNRSKGTAFVSLKNPNARSSKAYETIARSLLDEKDEGKRNARGMAAFFSHLVSGKR